MRNWIKHNTIRKKNYIGECIECGDRAILKLLKHNGDYIEVCENCFFRLRREELDIFK